MKLFKYLDQYSEDGKELKCPNIRINTVRYDKYVRATPRF